MQLDTTHIPVYEGGRCRGWGLGDVRNLLAGRIISAIMFFSQTSLIPAIFVSNRHFRKKWHLANRLPKRLVMDLTQSILYLAVMLHV